MQLSVSYRKYSWGGWWDLEPFLVWHARKLLILLYAECDNFARSPFRSHILATRTLLACREFDNGLRGFVIAQQAEADLDVNLCKRIVDGSGVPQRFTSVAPVSLRC